MKIGLIVYIPNDADGSDVQIEVFQKPLLEKSVKKFFDRWDDWGEEVVRKLTYSKKFVGQQHIEEKFGISFGFLVNSETVIISEVEQNGVHIGTLYQIEKLVLDN